MTENEAIFKAKSTIKSADIEHRQKINFNIGKYNAAVPQGKLQFANNELVKERAKNIKWRALETLDQHLEEFEMQFTKRGGKVIWAQNSQEALDEILAICKEKNCRTIVKSKSMVTEEIHLNQFLKQHDIESVETDLGEYIQQLDGEPPYHIVTPAMHKSKEDVAKVFENKLGYAHDLKRMGAKVTLFNPSVENPEKVYNFNLSDDDPSFFHGVKVEGPTPLHNAVVKTLDIRAGAALVLAALVAKGETTIHEVYRVDRGYEDFEKRLNSLGADIKRVSDNT